VSAPGEDSVATDAGAVFMYQRSGHAWSATSGLRPPNVLGVGDGFGQGLALSSDGSTLVAGAPGEDSLLPNVRAPSAADYYSTDNTSTDSGAAYVYRRSGDNWTQEAFVKSFESQAGEQFGMSVAVSADGSRFLVGAPQAGFASAGAAYVFDRFSPTWIEPQGF